MFNLFSQKEQVKFECEVKEAFEKAFEEKAPLKLHFAEFKDYYGHNIQFLNEHFKGVQNHECWVNIFRYMFMKAFEGRVSSYIYKNNPVRKKEAYDLFYSADEIQEASYRTNLPNHIERKIHAYNEKARRFAELLVDYVPLAEPADIGQLIILDQCMADAFALKAIEKHDLVTTVAGVNNSLLLTFNEVRKIAGENFYKMCLSRGYEIESYTDLIDSYDNFILRKDGTTYLLLFDAAVYPAELQFFATQLRGLYETAQEQNAIPLVAGIHVGSLNSEHFSNGIITKDDHPIVKFEGVSQLVIKKLDNPVNSTHDWYFENFSF